jgi:hypothetical protein
MAGEVRIGVEPAPQPPPRSGKVLGLAAGLVVLVAAGAWILGASGKEATTPSITTGPTTGLTAASTTTTEAAPTTTLPLEQRLQAARTFWSALGAGDIDSALAAVPDPAPDAADLAAFVAALHPAFTVGDCEEFAANAVSCLVVVANGDLLTIGTGSADQILTVEDDGWFGLPSVVGSAASRLSLYALREHTDDVHAACPTSDDPNVAHLAIVGSPTGACGAYLAGLIPEYLSSQGLSGGARE